MSGRFDDPPLLWGDWRCTPNPRMWIAQCAACAGELWIHRNGLDNWRVVCLNGCERDAIEAAAAELLREQRAEQKYLADLKATMDPSDPFWKIEATRYIEALTGQQPSRGGAYRCPFHSDGNERTPSLHTTEILPARWYCFACGRGGTVYDFAALLWNLEPRRDGFKEIRERLARELLRGAPLSSLTYVGPDGRREAF